MSKSVPVLNSQQKTIWRQNSTTKLAGFHVFQHFVQQNLYKKSFLRWWNIKSTRFFHLVVKKFGKFRCNNLVFSKIYLWKMELIQPLPSYANSASWVVTANEISSDISCNLMERR